MTAHRASGFTLVELLGGLAIAAIIMLPLADLLRTGTDSARLARSALDLNSDARLAVNRIAARAAASSLDATKLVPAVPARTAVGMQVDPVTWLAPFTYALSGTDLVETDPTVNPVRNTVIAANVTVFRLTAPEVVAGFATLGIELTLSADGNTVTRTRTVRVGGAGAPGAPGVTP